MVHQVQFGPEHEGHRRRITVLIGGDEMSNKGLRAHLPKGTYTRPMLAAKVGKSLRWIRQLELDGHIKWSRTKMFGNIEVKLYTEADVRKVRDFLAAQHHGRPAKKTAAAKKPSATVTAKLSDPRHRVKAQPRNRRKAATKA